ncbi:MAG: hypothetical protein AAGB19_22255, partial [Cyanobacteria bacterium P01_F01_bin.3]
ALGKPAHLQAQGQLQRRAVLHIRAVFSLPSARCQANHLCKPLDCHGLPMTPDQNKSDNQRIGIHGNVEQSVIVSGEKNAEVFGGKFKRHEPILLYRCGERPINNPPAATGG